MANFVPEKVKLSELLNDINEGKIQLPTFQRNYKWKQSQVKKLLDSIQAGYPAGSLLLLDVDPANPLLGFRTLEFVENCDRNPEILVLDGQQRLTSCYCALYNASSEKTYYLDYGRLYNEYYKTGKEDCNFEDLIVVRKHDSISDAECREKKYLKFSFLKSRKTFSEVKKEIGKYLQDEEIKNFITYDIDNYLESLFDYEFPVVRLSKEMSVEAICKIFETINTTGLKLSSFDICVAKFMRCNLNLRKKMDEVKTDCCLENIFDDNENLLLQAIALLANKSPKANALSKNLESCDIEKWWDKAVEGYKYIVDLLDRIGVGLKKNDLLLPYNPILPLFSALAIKCEKVIKSSFTSKSNFEEKIKKFFYTTAFSGRYAEGTDAKIQKDYDALYEWILENKTPDVMSRGVEWNTENRLRNTGNSAFGKAVLCLINGNEPQDFYIQNIVGQKTKGIETQFHHIFPTARYKDQYREERLNSVFNITLISAESNNYISDKKTKEYLQGIYKERGITEKSFKTTLRAHFIDDDCYAFLLSEDFEAFIRKRAELIKTWLEDMGITIKSVDAIEDDYIDME